MILVQWHTFKIFYAPQHLELLYTLLHTLRRHSNVFNKGRAEYTEKVNALCSTAKTS